MVVDAQIDPVGIFALKIFTEELCVGDINCGDEFRLEIKALHAVKHEGEILRYLVAALYSDPLALGNERPCKRRCAAERVAVRMRVAQQQYIVAALQNLCSFIQVNSHH